MPGIGIRPEDTLSRTRLAAGLAAVAVAGLLSSCSAASSGGCVQIRVAVTPELEPVATRNAADFDGKVDGRCVAVKVRSLGSSHGAAVLTGQEGDQDPGRPHAGVPGSSPWVPTAPGTPPGAANVAPPGTAVAPSPPGFPL